MSNRNIYILGTIATLVIGITGSIQVYNEMVTKHYGKQVEAKIVDVAHFCSRQNNRVEVELGQKTYSVLIGRTECIENKYQLDKVQSFIYHSGLDYMITTQRNPEVVIPIMIFIFIISIYSFRKAVRE